MSYTSQVIPVAEMLAKIHPALARESLVYGRHQFQTFVWDKQIWLRGTQISQALGQKKGWCTNWHAGHSKKFNEKTSRVPSLNALEPNKKGRHRKQRTRIFSLQGVILLMNIIGTPESIDFGEWAAYAIHQYDHLIDEKKIP